MEYVRPIQIRQRYDITSKQLKLWSRKHDIRTIKTPSGRTLYHLGDFHKLIGEEEKKNVKRGLIYTRVSSHQQKDDLERQVVFMRSKYPGLEVIKDIGSGVNFKRKGLQKMLRYISEGSIDTLYVSEKDRILRFGFELFEWISKHFGTKIHFEYHEKEDTRELADDLLAITNVFVSKRNGQKSARNRKERKLREERESAKCLDGTRDVEEEECSEQ